MSDKDKPPESLEVPDYLGDGVYAAFNGYELTLTTSNGIETTNIIFCDSEVITALRKYLDKLPDKAK